METKRIEIHSSYSSVTDNDEPYYSWYQLTMYSYGKYKVKNRPIDVSPLGHLTYSEFIDEGKGAFDKNRRVYMDKHKVYERFNSIRFDDIGVSNEIIQD